MKTWRDKANRLISKLCLEANRAANLGHKKHVPYRVPELAKELVDCLEKNDEHRAKSLFLSYDGLKALGD